VGIDAVVPGAWGWTRAGGWVSPLNQRLGVAGGAEHLLVWRLDAEHSEGRDQHGRTVALRPFPGVIGMPPDEPGIHTTFPPRATGGNLDCRELVAGSRLFLPIAVAGALVSAGDGHAAQGDGEVSGLAIECPLERLDLTYRLREDLPLATPWAETPIGTITFGFHRTLDEAAANALEAMLQLLGARLGSTRRDALALASVTVDLRITQMVNGVSGVHAVLPVGAPGHGE
jgi:acetamidase/formamidase